MRSTVQYMLCANCNFPVLRLVLWHRLFIARNRKLSCTIHRTRILSKLDSGHLWCWYLDLWCLLHTQYCLLASQHNLVNSVDFEYKSKCKVTDSIHRRHITIIENFFHRWRAFRVLRKLWREITFQIEGKS
jgi:hypothetical protein